MTITLSAAQDAIAAATTKAIELGVPSTITVVDTGARVIAVARQDGAPLVSIDASLAKARTSMFFGGATTGDLQAAVQPGAPLFGLGEALSDAVAFLPGGFPLTDDTGAVIGAIGSSGGSPDQDALIAEAATTPA